MWQAHAERLDAATTRVTVHWCGAPISIGDALERCQSDPAFRERWIDELARAPFAGYFWETPPITRATLGRRFEFVLSEARGLATAAPEPSAFQEHFGGDGDGDGIVAFENLGRDAMLVVPCPAAAASCYAHLAAFVRGAPPVQKHALFRCVASAVLARVSDRPLWLSTAGMGVYWLHVRLDSRPKYYRHAPYRTTS